ncbi:hypothetical protein OGAPHI_003604 [Ogataea philodendri]|uniref:Uncharacterized protein n=1 Tax=Ogataea philodendri TaxID=1378263 RepID=A0A9P8T4U4_9ASCO|nr:uncharacterized protein OGAPHI_003604 [Ogataea philodendri]KAH3665420.1 hypothetical protein OGAPHI_003604 [Ogataea philodendri]
MAGLSVSLRDFDKLSVLPARCKITIAAYPPEISLPVTDYKTCSLDSFLIIGSKVSTILRLTESTNGAECKISEQRVFCSTAVDVEDFSTLQISSVNLSSEDDVAKV